MFRSDMQTDKWIERKMDRKTEGHNDIGQKDGKADKQKGRKTGIQKNRETDRQKDKKTETEGHKDRRT
jgi:hypothetical protein